MNSPADVPHPGIRIKTEIIPKRMSVTKAAELLGVGRPALSNLLNGKASLSADMAARLEKAFNYPLKDLLEMQSRYEAAQATQKSVPADIKTYVPPFLAIKANDIEKWVTSNIRARSRLAVFLRTLVHSTGNGLTKVDFPGNDDAERPRWDGFVEAKNGTPWVPAGSSGWEFGTNEDPKTKADGDFEKSVKAFGKKEQERKETTFVFVTPRRWPGKQAWIAAMRAKNLWQDVRAYDSSDLEQWLEQSLPAQAWFANETNVPAQNVRSLDKCWTEWAGVSDPPLTGALFTSAIDAAKRTVHSRLSKPSNGPILIAADSTQEALAFLSHLLSERGGDELAEYRDRVLVFDKPGVFPNLAMGAQTFIPVAFTQEVERELAPYAKSMHSFVIYPRNAVSNTPDIVLEPASNETFNKALDEMGMSRDKISELANSSGRSLTVLRRRLSDLPGVQKPEWAAVPNTASKLVPFLFVGAWNSQNETDKEGLTLLAGGRSYEDLEKDCQYLAQLNDAPIWSIGTYRGAISKIDLLFAIAGTLTRPELERYFSIARMVLGEDDPALDLDEKDRWAAAIHGKVRKFSRAFREGISETLVLLTVHGKELFNARIGIDIEFEVIKVIRDLLPMPLTTRKLEANDQDLPTYAEAAPGEFLNIIERDLKTENPAVLGLLRPVDSGIFGSGPARSGLLWALEGLAWSPETATRAILILARLAQVEINDNWSNKPVNSLKSIFRAWMPQTAASTQQRIELMKKLATNFPNVAWEICIAQFGHHNDIGHYNHKPRWRTDGYGYGEPFPTWWPVHEFVRAMVEMALNWKNHSLSTLSDLVERLQNLSDEHQGQVWKLIENWAKNTENDNDKAVIREKIRVSTMSRRAALRAKKQGKPIGWAIAGKAAYAALEPSDLLNKHAWLFRDSWIDYSADELDVTEEIDFKKRDEFIKEQRVKALQEIYADMGLAGILELSERGRASWTIGALLANEVLNVEDLKELVLLALKPIITGQENVYSYKNLIGGAIHALENEDVRGTVLQSIGSKLSEVERIELLLLAPFCKNTWDLVDAQGLEAQSKYWDEITPNWIRDSNAETNEAVERLLNAKRPRAAFLCIYLKPSAVDANTLFRLLTEMAQGGNDLPGQFQVDQYHIEQAFEYLDTSSALTLEQKAGLEFTYIDVLERPRGRRESPHIPNLEKYVAQNPELFIQAVCWSYKRADRGSDPEEYQIPQESIQRMGERGHKLLDALQRIPGHDDLGEFKADQLAKWISAVRQKCGELSRGDIADICIGKLLSHAPVGEDGIWPCESVRDLMEELQSEHIMSGAHTGIYNSRGAHWRGEGGDQERELAEKYRKWALALQVSHPFVSSKLLMDMATTYEREASHNDIEAGIRRRLR